MTAFSARLGTRVLTAAVLVAGVLATQPVWADQVVATYVADGKTVEVKESQLEEIRATLPPQVAQQATPARLAEMFITYKLVADDARKDGLLKDANVIKAQKRAEDQILREAWANKKGAADIPDAVLKKKYDEAKAQFKPQEEVHAHHILVETEDQAKGVISELRAGASFEDIAKNRSKDPTGARSGGDLGYFTRDQMVAEFADAAFALQPGSYSQTPVKTQFGWHVIRADDHRMQTFPSFDDPNFKPYMRQQLGQEAVQKAVSDLRDKAKISIKVADQPVAPPAGK